jgi:hypothetical protein
MRGPALWRGLAQASWPVWFSGFCWSVMFTAFMLAITLTTVANVLVTMAIGPLITALFTRLFLNHRLPAQNLDGHRARRRGHRLDVLAGGAQRTVAGRHLVALAVPLAAALNFTTLQHVGHRRSTGDTAAARTCCQPFSSAPCCRRRSPCRWRIRSGRRRTTSACWPCSASFNWRFRACCSCACRASWRRRRSPCSGLLEVVFGVAWAWLGAGEQPGSQHPDRRRPGPRGTCANEALALLGPRGRIHVSGGSVP